MKRNGTSGLGLPEALALALKRAVRNGKPYYILANEDGSFEVLTVRCTENRVQAVVHPDKCIGLLYRINADEASWHYWVSDLLEHMLDALNKRVVQVMSASGEGDGPEPPPSKIISLS